MFKEFFKDDFEHSSKTATKVLVDYTLGTPKYGADKTIEMTADRKSTRLNSSH